MQNKEIEKTCAELVEACNNKTLGDWNTYIALHKDSILDSNVVYWMIQLQHAIPIDQILLRLGAIFPLEKYHLKGRMSKWAEQSQRGILTRSACQKRK